LKRIPFFKRIGFKLALFCACGILIVGGFSVAYISGSNQGVISQINTERSRMALSTMQAILDEYRTESVTAAQSLAADEAIAKALESGDAAAARSAANDAVSRMQLSVDFVTMTDDRGNVIARTHSDKAGDSVISQKNVSQALAGEITTHTDLGSEIKLSIRTGAPVKNTLGKIVGVVSTGLSLVSPAFVDKLKNMTGNEFTVFIGDERANTTILKDGQRVVGTKLDPRIAKIVLEERTVYTGEADILGAPYATAYQPILDTDGNAIGVYFAGVSIGGINALRQKSIFNSILIELVLIALVIAALLWYQHRMIARPLSNMTGIAGEIARGNLNLTVSHASGDELGILADSMQTTVTSIKGYIRDISDKLVQMSQGDMRVKVDMDYAGDFAPIKTALLDISTSLNHTLLAIKTASEQVSTGAGQVSSGAQALASGSTEQASSIEELSASVARIAVQAAENSVNVKVATGYVEQAGTGMGAGNLHMKQLTDAMENIGSASSQIVSVTKVIEDIAFQTNILALNAAIEAASAGNAGKGFAVVADEVRNLAAKSAEAAKQTAELIQRSNDTVAKGSQVAIQTAQILKDVEAKALLANESIAKINQSSQDQAAAIDQIKLGLNQISSVVQTNAATAEENSATSEEMSAQADTLNEEVKKFRLDANQVKLMI
jgi:methyl-accepting chemotaxis protein